MSRLIMDRELRTQYKEMIEKLDSDVRELEEIHEEMDKSLYEIEKRIARLRRSERD